MQRKTLFLFSVIFLAVGINPRFIFTQTLNLDYSTYLGGNGSDYGRGISLGTDGRAYITGTTVSYNFPIENPYQAGSSGSSIDVFVSALSSSGSALSYSTYLGGSDSDYGYGISLGTDGAAYVAGSTISPDFPTENPYQAVWGGNYDAFVSRLTFVAPPAATMTPTPSATPTSTPIPSVTPTTTPIPTIPMATATPTATPSVTPISIATPTGVPITLVKTAGDIPDGDIYIARIAEAITFYYRVTNTGTGDLDTVVVTDDNGTPYDPSDDFIVGVVAGPVTPGTAFTLQTTLSVWVQHLNTGWARSTIGGEAVSASDDVMIEAWVVTAGNDYNGDGIAYPGTWEFANGRWWLKRDDSELPEVAYFGSSGDVVASGDYDGDGTTDLTIFRPLTGLWAARGVTRFYFGGGNDLPVPGDYNGDGTADPGIYRGSSGLWAIRGISRLYYGTAQDLPIPGDYEGSGTTRTGIFRPASNLWAIRGMTRRYFGMYGDYPAPADYDGDGTMEIGIYRPPIGLWAISGVTRIYFGTINDVPQPADYEGSGTAGLAIYRPGSSLWAIRGFTRQYWGGLNNIPVN